MLWQCKALLLLQLLLHKSGHLLMLHQPVQDLLPAIKCIRVPKISLTLGGMTAYIACGCDISTQRCVHVLAIHNEKVLVCNTSCMPQHEMDCCEWKDRH